MAASFDWTDPLRLQDQLTEEERLVYASAQQFAAEVLKPRVTQEFRFEKTDPAIFREMGKVGLLGPGTAVEYGGTGLGAVAQGLVNRAVESVDSGLPFDDERPVFAGDVTDRTVWHGSPETKIPPRPRGGRKDRLLRPDRTRLRQRRGEAS